MNSRKIRKESKNQKSRFLFIMEVMESLLLVAPYSAIGISFLAEVLDLNAGDQLLP